MRCKLTFICDKKWEDLKGTSSTDIRYCDSCEREVFLIRNEGELDENRRKSRCVAFSEDYKFANRSERNIYANKLGNADKSISKELEKLRNNKRVEIWLLEQEAPDRKKADFLEEFLRVSRIESYALEDFRKGLEVKFIDTTEGIADDFIEHLQKFGIKSEKRATQSAEDRGHTYHEN